MAQSEDGVKSNGRGFASCVLPGRRWVHISSRNLIGIISARSGSNNHVSVVFNTTLYFRLLDHRGRCVKSPACCVQMLALCLTTGIKGTNGTRLCSRNG